MASCIVALSSGVTCLEHSVHDAALLNSPSHRFSGEVTSIGLLLLRFHSQSCKDMSQFSGCSSPQLCLSGQLPW